MFHNPHHKNGVFLFSRKTSPPKIYGSSPWSHHHQDESSTASRNAGTVPLNCDFCSSWKPSKEAFCRVNNPKLSCGLSQTSFWCSIHGYPQRFRWVFPMVDTCWYPNVLQNPPFLHIFLPFPDLKFSNPMKISGLDIPWHPDGSQDENCPQPALVAPGPSLLSFQFVQLGSLRCLGRGFPHFPHTEICGDHAEMWGISWWYNGRVGRIICLAQEKHGASAALSYFSFERIAACTWRAAMGPSRLKSNGEKFWPLFW